MVFSELYSAYYNAVAAVLRAACAHPVSRREISGIVQEYAFSESLLSIVPALTEEKWQLMRRDGTAAVSHEPTMPLTMLEKRWIKSVLMDPRIRLFEEALPDFPDVEPLFLPGDIAVFDRYADGDPFEDETYRAHFRQIVRAIHEQTVLEIEFRTGKGMPHRVRMRPDHLEYSEKDDKFRVVGSAKRSGETINLARIASVHALEGTFRAEKPEEKDKDAQGFVTFDVVDERNALERVLMHFAHFAKEAEKGEEGHFRVTVHYDRSDETEMVIRILSFGPKVRVTAPDSFVNLIRQRLLRQQKIGL